MKLVNQRDTGRWVESWYEVDCGKDNHKAGLPMVVWEYPNEDLRQQIMTFPCGCQHIRELKTSPDWGNEKTKYQEWKKEFQAIEKELK